MAATPGHRGVEASDLLDAACSVPTHDPSIAPPQPRSPTNRARRRSFRSPSSVTLRGGELTNIASDEVRFRSMLTENPSQAKSTVGIVEAAPSIAMTPSILRWGNDFPEPDSNLLDHYASAKVQNGPRPSRASSPRSSSQTRPTASQAQDTKITVRHGEEGHLDIAKPQASNIDTDVRWVHGDSPSLFIPIRGTAVGKRSYHPPPKDVEKSWIEDIRPRLVRDLLAVLQTLPSSLRREETAIEPELCMSGTVVKARILVALRPTIWIRCGSRLCQTAVQRAVADLDYLRQYQIHVTLHSPHADHKANPLSITTKTREKNVRDSDSGFGSRLHAVFREDVEMADMMSVGTTFSDDSVVLPTSRECESLIAAFVDDLQSDLALPKPSADVLGRLITRLPHLLKYFSLRLGLEARNEAEFQAVDIIRQRRTRAVDHFCSSCRDQSTSQDTQADKIPRHKTEKIDQWDGHSDDLDPELESFDDDPPPDYRVIRSFLRNSPAYSWLLKSIQASACLTDRGVRVMEITRKLEDLFGRYSASKGRRSRYEVHYQIDWNLLEFLRKQQYDTDEESMVESAIAITGSALNAQALTCLEYMKMTWPTTGPEVLRSLQKAVSSTSVRASTYEAMDGTEVDISLEDSVVIVRARGGQAALTELCEQLAWLGSALRDSQEESGLWLVSPEIHTSRPRQFRLSSRKFFHEQDKKRDKEKFPSLRLSVQIDFISLPASIQGQYPSGSSTCWHGLFRNPTIVQGFPILARPLEVKGLEISLDMLYTLAETRYATRYDSALLLKGHSTLLIPVRREDSSIMWHFLHRNDGQRIPYYDFRKSCPKEMITDDLFTQNYDSQEFKHFVGWTPYVSRYLGAEAVEYDKIAWAGARKCKSGLALEQKLTISVSKIVGISGTVVRGNRDKPEYVKYPTLKAQIQCARNMSVVLYDTATQRSWLVDGASALLHLVRTQLVHQPYRTDSSLTTADKFDNSKFKHPHPDLGPDEAFKALSNEDNWKHIISREFDSYAEEKMEPAQAQIQPAQSADSPSSTTSNSKKEERKEVYKTTCFRQLVSQTWSTLEQIEDRQRDATTTHLTKELDHLAKAELEGYEYMGIVNSRHTLTRRAVALGSNGSAWLDLINKARAIVLFGENFGDIFAPGGTAQRSLCSPWLTVPHGQEYLTAPISHMVEIQQRSFEEGEVKKDSCELAEGIFWHPSPAMLSPCHQRCKHHIYGRVQRISKKDKHATCIAKLNHLPLDGAIILGKKSTLNARTLAPPSLQSQDEGSLHDSGLGSSLTSATPSAAETDLSTQAIQTSSAAGHNATILPPAGMGSNLNIDNSPNDISYAGPTTTTPRFAAGPSRRSGMLRRLFRRPRKTGA